MLIIISHTHTSSTSMPLNYYISHFNPYISGAFGKTQTSGINWARPILANIPSNQNNFTIAQSFHLSSKQTRWNKWINVWCCWQLYNHFSLPIYSIQSIHLCGYKQSKQIIIKTERSKNQRVCEWQENHDYHHHPNAFR